MTAGKDSFLNSPFTEFTGKEVVSNQNTNALMQIGFESVLLEPDTVNKVDTLSYYPENYYDTEIENEDPVQLNQGYSLDLGWGNYSDKINNLLLKATRQSNITLYGDSFTQAVIEWKRQNGFPLSIVNGVIDMDAWKKISDAIGVTPLIFSITDHYAKMDLSVKGLSFEAFKIACNGFRNLEKDEQLKNNKVLSIADFTQSSRKKRLYILDMVSVKVIMQIKVSHGKKSVKAGAKGESRYFPTEFSNIKGSNQSSLGFYVTQRTFNMPAHKTETGLIARGRALYIEGKENDFNSLARKRAIVIHGAEYVHEVGEKPAEPSWGCPAIDFKVREAVLATIKEGTCFFIYFNAPDYLKKSLLAADSSFGPVPGISHEYKYRDDNKWEEKNIEAGEDEVDYEEEYPLQFDEPKSGITEYLNVSALNDSSFKTGVFIPAGFSQSNKVDIVIYLHGQFRYGNEKCGIKYYWTSYSNIRECFSQSQRNAILIAPTLGRDPQSPAILLKSSGGLDNFVSACLKELITKTLLPPGSEPRNIILAAHSAGGSPLSKILTNPNNLLNNVIECWGFDCLYSYNWENALKKNPGKTLFHYWALTVGGSMSGPGTRGANLQKSYSNLKNIAPGKGVHHRQVIEDAWINKINVRAWFNPVSSTPSSVTKEFGNLEIEHEDDEFDPYYSESEYTEKNKEPELTDEHELYKSYNSELNFYNDEEDIESEDEDEAEDYRYGEAESEDSENIDFQIPEDRFKKWTSKYVPLLDRQKNKDKNELTNLIFNDLHPDRHGKKLTRSDSKNLIQEWKDIYNEIVSPYLFTRGFFVNGEGRGISTDKVKYLALEGGGGRGAVYIGAIKALEEKGILPIRPGGQILGLSGSSAGAITCFLLSLGYTSDQIQKELFPRNGESIFGNFINDIEPGCFRMITKDFKAGYRKPKENEVNDNFEKADLALIKNIFDTFKWQHPYLSTLMPESVEKIPKLFFSLLDFLMVYIVKWGAPAIGNELGKLNTGTKVPSIYNLLHDGGYFTGFGVRQVLQTWFNEFNRTKDNHYDSNINFEQFYKLTGVDFKVTGTNITQGYGAFFSKDTTPKFPVVEAIGISGCFPFVFKPIWVDNNELYIHDGIKVYDSRLGDYSNARSRYKRKSFYGFWADGGIANNLPLHAFDGAAGGLNKNVLALRLTPPNKNEVTLSQMINPTTVKNYTLNYYKNLLVMLTNASEESQLRTGDEGIQTIDLDTGTLETTIFTPDFSVWKEFSDLAKIKVSNYFNE